MAIEQRPQVPPHHLPEGQVPTGTGTITRPPDISPSLAEAAVEGTATVTRSASIGGLSIGKLPLIGGAIMTLAGGAFALNQLRHQETTPPAFDANRASDTVKPPEPAPNQPNLIVNPPFTENNPGQAANTSGNPPKESSTSVAIAEVKKGFDCGILSPEACAMGEHIEWTVSSGRKFSGMAFTIRKPGEEIKIPENLAVAGTEIKQPNTYNGFRITAARKDGTGEFNYFGDIIPNNIERVGKDLPARTVVGTIAGSGTTVFKEADYNLLIVFPTENELQNTFEQAKNPPKKIDNIPIQPAPGGGLTFFDVKPPVSSSR